MNLGSFHVQLPQKLTRLFFYRWILDNGLPLHKFRISTKMFFPLKTYLLLCKRGLPVTGGNKNHQVKLVWDATKGQLVPAKEGGRNFRATPLEKSMAGTWKWWSLEDEFPDFIGWFLSSSGWFAGVWFICDNIGEKCSRYLHVFFLIWWHHRQCPCSHRNENLYQACMERKRETSGEKSMSVVDCHDLM